MSIDATVFRNLFPDIAKHCGRSGLDALLNAMTELQVEAGHVVIREGEESGNLYFVIEGELTSSLEGNGNVLEMGSVTAGDTFCKANLLDPGPATMTVTAATNVTLLVLSHNAFRELEKLDLQMTGNLLRMLSDELIELCRNADRILFNRSSGINNDTTQNNQPDIKKWAAKVYKKLHGEPEEQS